jgi:crotonobetainyl-CoA:carnitine CoA-transferase CaiB-like acyl-CoA transferase
VNPGLVFVGITGFGEAGPYHDYRFNDLAAYAGSGWMATMGDPDKPPVYPGREYPAYVAGLYAAFGSLSAYRHVRRTGQGQQLAVSILDAAVSVQFYEATSYSMNGELRRRDGNRVHAVASSVQPCRDGYVALTVSGDPAWRAFTEALGCPELAEGEFATAVSRAANKDALQNALQEVLRGWDVADVVRECQARRVAVSPVLTPAEILRSPQHEARGWLVALEHPEAGRLVQTGSPFRFSRNGAADVRLAPRLGEHDDEIRSRFGAGVLQ